MAAFETRGRIQSGNGAESPPGDTAAAAEMRHSAEAPPMLPGQRVPRIKLTIFYAVFFK